MVVVTKSLCGFVLNQLQYNMESPQIVVLQKNSMKPRGRSLNSNIYIYVCVCVCTHHFCMYGLDSVLIHQVLFRMLVSNKFQWFGLVSLFYGISTFVGYLKTNCPYRRTAMILFNP